MAVFRPGDDPVGHLATALASPDVLGLPGEEFAATNRVLMEATLRRGRLGLLDAVRQARIPRDHNLLVLVDQFEELFRFRRNPRIANSRDDAIAFVRLLLEAARQGDVPVYVAMTMRSDFIGDCMDFPGLSDAVNAGLYLVGRMSRDALSSAIAGPVAVGGGTIAPRLVSRVLNDLGDDHDQLPRMQHALMRTWDHWSRTHAAEAPIDLADYEAVGGFDRALSLHAEEAFAEAVAEGCGGLAEHVFKALTDTTSDPRGVRRPATVREIAETTGASTEDVIRTVDVFRRAGRSFLMPPAAAALADDSVVDLSHESLMRCWSRLATWAAQERAAAEFYLRLSGAAVWFVNGAAGLWRNPELELAQRWRQENRPTAAWARRYDDKFELAMTFLDASIERLRSAEREREQERRLRLRRTQWTAAVLATLLVVALAFAWVARRENARAETNLELAREAVDESLTAAERDPAQSGADLPQVEQLRRDLLAKAQRFYAAFIRQAPTSEKLRRDVAFAHLRLGHIDRMLEKRENAAKEYSDAIAGFRELASARRANAEYRAALGDAYNWLGETLRPQAGRREAAAQAYDSALVLQQELADREPGTAEYRRALARTHYNRGILRSTADRGAAAAEVDFRDAIRLLEPLAASDARSAQELARAYNNLGSLLAGAPARTSDVRALWEKAIAIDERLVAGDGDSREYKLELATYCSNLAALLNDTGDAAAADRRSHEALALLEDLARLAPSLAVARADAHGLRAGVLQARDAVMAEVEYANAVQLFSDGATDPALLRLTDYHLRFGDLLLSLSSFAGRANGTERARTLLSRAVATYAGIASRLAADGSPADAQLTLDTLSRVLPAIPPSDRATLLAASTRLQHMTGGRR